MPLQTFNFTLPSGEVATRRSATHIYTRVVVANHHTDNAPFVYQWCSRPELAQRAAREARRRGYTGVRVDAVDSQEGEDTFHARPSWCHWESSCAGETHPRCWNRRCSLEGLRAFYCARCSHCRGE